MSRFQNFTPPTLGSELTTSEITMLEELTALANSGTGEFIRKSAGSLENATLLETIAFSGLSDVALSSVAQGDIIFYNGSSWVNLTAGITGQFLQTQGTGANPIWDTGLAGTVSLVSVVTANGVSGSVATATTTPAITLTLGAITPTSVAIGGGTALTTSNQTGTGNIVLATSPTFTTSLTTPLIIGGTGTTDDLTLKTTSGVGATGADMHFLVGNNGATEAMTILNNGNVGIGTAAPTNKLHIVSSGGVTNASLAVDASSGTGQADLNLIAGNGATNRAARIDFLNIVTHATTPQWTLLNDYFQNGTNDFNVVNYAGTRMVTFLQGGNVGIGTTGPTAVLHLKAGTATASTAPLKFTSGTLNTTAEAGAVEFLTDAFYGTITTGAARKTFAFLESPSFTTPTLGTPASGVLTNCTGLPAASVLAGSFGAGAYVISTSLQAATIELGHATDTTLSRVSAGVIAVEGVTIPSISSTDTLTNKTLTSPRVGTAILDTNGNEIIKTPATTSAVNEVTVTNAAVGGVPQVAATGDDAAIHLDLRGKGNALVKTAVLRQDVASNGYHVNSVILTGWGFWTGDGSTKRAAKAVTFGLTFSAAPIVIFGGLGYLGSDPTAIGNLTAIAASIGDLSFTYASTDITTTGFVAEITNAGTVLTATWRLGFSWICIGQLN